MDRGIGQAQPLLLQHEHRAGTELTPLSLSERGARSPTSDPESAIENAGDNSVVIAKGGSVTYQGQRIGFCCPPCIARFNKDPEKYMRRMRAEPESYGYTPPKR